MPDSEKHHVIPFNGRLALAGPWVIDPDKPEKVRELFVSDLWATSMPALVGCQVSSMDRGRGRAYLHDQAGQPCYIELAAWPRQLDRVNIPKPRRRGGIEYEWQNGRWWPIKRKRGEANGG